MGEEEGKKKKRTGVAGAYDNAIEATQTAGQGYIDASAQQAQQNADFLAQQNASIAQQENDEWAKVLAGQKRLADYWGQRLKEQELETKNAEFENDRRTQMENRRASMVGAGQLAASLINLYSVGSLHAANQVYKDHMQDWMRKADMDRKMRRARIDNLRERQRGIGDKLAGLEAANTQEEYNHWRQQAADQAKRAQAEQEARSSIPLIRAKGEADLAAQTAKMGIEGARAADQSAQGWANIQQAKDNLQFQKDKYEAGMRAEGLNPDGTPNEELMKKIVETRSRISGGGKATSERVFVDKNGDVNVAHLDKEEMEDLMKLARGTIAGELGEDEAKQFNNEMRAAINDEKQKDAVLKKWMARSKTCGEAIRRLDPAYAGQHGPIQPQQPENKSGFANVQKDEKKEAEAVTGLKQFI